MRNIASVFRHAGPFRGLMTKVDEESVSLEWATTCSNIDTSQGTIKRRKGYEGFATFVSVTFPLTVLRPWHRIDGNKYMLIKRGTQYATIQDGTDVIANINNLAVSVAPPNVVIIGDNAIFIDGTDPPVYFHEHTGGTIAWELDFPAPTSTMAGLASLTTASTSLPRNTSFTYQLTHYSTWTEFESNPSATSNEVNTSTDSDVVINLSSLTLTSDYSITHFRVYRKNLTAGDTDWYLLTTALATFTDTTDDFDEAYKIAANSIPQRNWGWPNISFDLGTSHRGRLFVASSGQTRVYYSELFGPVHVGDSNWEDIGDEDNEGINAIISFQDQLIVGKTRSIWGLFGDPETTSSWFTRQMVPDVGISGKQAFVNIDNMLYLVSHRGVYRYNGREAEYLTLAIEDWWFENVDQSRLHNAVVADDKRNGLLLVSVTTNGNSTPDTTLVLCYRVPPRVTDRGVFYAWNVWGLPATCWGQAGELTNQQLRFGLGDPETDGYYVAYLYGEDNDAEDDGGTAIDWHWQTPRLNMGIPERKKRFHTITVRCDDPGVQSDIRVGYTLDDGSFTGGVTNDANSKQTIKNPLRRRAYEIGIRLDGQTTVGPIEVKSMAIDFEPLGYR